MLKLNIFGGIKMNGGKVMLTSDYRKIKVWFDPNIINRKNKIGLDGVDLEKEFSEMNKLLDGKGTSRLGQSQSLSKSKRLLILKQGIDSGKIKFVEDVLDVLVDIKTLNSVDGYLREINRNLRSKETNKLYGPSDETIEKKKNKYKRNSDKNTIYYDKDPTDGGVEISQEDYFILVESMKKEYGIDQT